MVSICPQHSLSNEYFGYYEVDNSESKTCGEYGVGNSESKTCGEYGVDNGKSKTCGEYGVDNGKSKTCGKYGVDNSKSSDEKKRLHYNCISYCGSKSTSEFDLRVITLNCGATIKSKRINYELKKSLRKIIDGNKPTIGVFTEVSDSIINFLKRYYPHNYLSKRKYGIQRSHIDCCGINTLIFDVEVFNMYDALYNNEISNCEDYTLLKHYNGGSVLKSPAIKPMSMGLTSSS